MVHGVPTLLALWLTHVVGLMVLWDTHVVGPMALLLTHVVVPMALLLTHVVISMVLSLTHVVVPMAHSLTHVVGPKLENSDPFTAGGIFRRLRKASPCQHIQSPPQLHGMALSRLDLTCFSVGTRSLM